MTGISRTPPLSKRFALRLAAAVAVAALPAAGVVALRAATDVPQGSAPADALVVQEAVRVDAATPAGKPSVRKAADPVPLGPEAVRPNPERGLVYRGLRRATKGPCVGLFALGTTSDECTHGPDAAPKGVDVDTRVPPVNDPEVAAPGGSDAEVAEAVAPDAELAAAVTGAVPCDGDGVSGNRVEVLYVHPEGTDRYATYLNSFRTWAAGIDTIYDESAKETGGSRHVRFVTETVDGTCVPTVANVTVSASAIGNFSSTNKELQAQGFNRRDRKYVIFADADVYCGIGSFAGDTTKGASNRSNFGPSYGRSDSGCWNATTAAHELGHNLGAVNNDSPNTTGSGHCVDEYDIMCYSDSPDYPSMVVKCNDRAGDSRLDCNHDDYYNTSPAPGSYLATSFNVADNVFLSVPGASVTTTTTTRTTTSSRPTTPVTTSRVTSSPVVTTLPPTTASPTSTPVTTSWVTSVGPTTGLPPSSTTGATPTATTSPDTPPTPCGLPEAYTGTLTGRGDGNYQPDGGYYYQSRRQATMTACLSGPDVTDFDLYLSRWTGRSWRTVARSIATGSAESVTYTGGRGYYRWTVRSWYGDGDYTLGLQRR
ncbi:MAG: hypothetical protein GXX79_13595 [Actinomycetales bacterium]|nr:hypothetical protein [Actinomycetales bacterium]